MKDKKRILRELGFHHSYGVWISDTDKKIRIKLHGSGKGNGYYALTNRCHMFDSKDYIKFTKTTDRDDLKFTLLEKLLTWV